MAGSKPLFDLEKFRESLADCLARDVSPGSFSYWNSKLPSINPGLSIKDVGPIALPVHDYEAERMIKHARKAPYGKGAETLLDESVRKTWEIDRQDISLENRKYASWLAVVLSDAKDKLGLRFESGVRAELYKLLIYGEGAHFKPHRDTEKVPGMFGTLVVCLPSRHQGGDLRLIHANHERSYSTAAVNHFELSCAAWYSDVLHSVQPVTSGYRVVLTYNLVLDVVNFQPSANIDNDELLKRLIASYVHELKEDPSNPPELIYKLDHKYTEANISMDRLKREDRDVALRLQKAAGDKCDVYLALLERKVDGACEEGEDEIYDVNEDKTVLKQIINLNGEVVASDLEVEETSFVQDDLYEDRSPDEEENEGYTGNEGGSATHWYRDAVLVVVPRVSAFSFLLGSGLQNIHLLPNKIETLLKRLTLAKSERQDVLAELTNICGICIDRAIKCGKQFGSRKLNGPDIDTLIKGSAAAGQDVLGRALELFNERTPLECFETLGKHLKTIIDGGSHCFESVKRAVAKQRTPQTKYDALVRFKQSALAGVPEQAAQVSTFMTSAFELVFSAFPAAFQEYQIYMLKLGDGRALVSLLWETTQNDKQQAILEKAKSLMRNAAFAIGALNELVAIAQWPETQKPLGSEFDGWLTLLFDTAMHGFDLSKCLDHANVLSFELNKPPRYLQNAAWIQPRTRGLPPSGHYQGIAELKQNIGIAEASAAFFKGCLRVDIGRANKFLGILGVNILNCFKPYHLGSFIVPFIRASLDILEPQSGVQVYEKNSYRDFCKRAIRIYVEQVAGTLPQEPQSWAREKVRCGCDDCKMLNKFLVDSEQMQGRFSMAEKRRRHLSSELSRTQELHDERTEAQRSPYTLVVTKNKRAYHERLRNWEDTTARVETDLKQLGAEALQRLLDPECFINGNLVVAKLPFLTGVPIAREPLAPRSDNSASQKRSHPAGESTVANKKSKLDIIDLT